ncbi:MAG: hypothetical protein Q8O67_26450 [Deltaproteobacteria bacterium]|nr:hypothetical protein [Deltaproteobacteria bacterium]
MIWSRLLIALLVLSCPTPGMAGPSSTSERAEEEHEVAGAASALELLNRHRAVQPPLPRAPLRRVLPRRLPARVVVRTIRRTPRARSRRVKRCVLYADDDDPDQLTR